MEGHPPAQPADPPTHALRLLFSYSGTDVHLVTVQRVEMLAPAAETTTIEEGQTGSWVEIRSVDQYVLYQRVLHNPIAFEVEAAQDPDSGRMRWHPVEHPEGTVELVVPDLAQAETLRLYASPRWGERATELVRLTLADVAPDHEEET
jgi:hypothetical protein